MKRERRHALEAGCRGGRVRRRAPAAAPRRAGHRTPPGPAVGRPRPAPPRDRGRQPAPGVPRVGRGARPGDGARRLRALRDGAARHPLDGGAPRGGAARAGRRRGPRAPDRSARPGPRGRLPPGAPRQLGVPGRHHGPADRPLGGGRAPARQPGARPAAGRLPRLDREHRHLQAEGPPGGAEEPARGTGRGDRGRPERPGEGRDLRALLRPARLRDDRGGGARAEDGLPDRAGALRAASRRALSHGLRPAGRVVELGPARRGRRPAHAGHRVDHRGLGARDPRAVAVAAPAVEDATGRIPRDPQRTRRVSRGSAVSPATRNRAGAPADPSRPSPKPLGRPARPHEARPPGRSP